MSSLGLCRKVATEVSKKVQLKDPNKPNSVLNLFKSYEFSDTQISTVVLSKPEKNLLPRLRFLQSIVFSSSELQDPIISNYGLLRQNWISSRSMVGPEMSLFRPSANIHNS
ncbi:hypothetical protein QN277_018686 [Acacia crassicarpa]|uniref:Uncharacterized protein n=1 Tax=Acacia crassicarpa TaxID=499986 RepID=A0AAE1JWI0_9FABA|nr:hypothetical protein QN277_018686 [Acacia crassicarpa]